MNTESFLIRHIGPRDEDIKKMLKVIKAKSLDELIDQTLPNDIKLKARKYKQIYFTINFIMMPWINNIEIY